MPDLILTVGLPRSGKSTWARSTGIPIVSPDALRLTITGQRFWGDAEPIVWAMAKTFVQSLFTVGHQVVILDATNGNAERRHEWVRPSKWRTLYRPFSATAAECIERAKRGGRLDLVPVIDRMATVWHPLSPIELANIATDEVINQYFE